MVQLLAIQIIIIVFFWLASLLNFLDKETKDLLLKIDIVFCIIFFIADLLLLLAGLKEYLV